MWQPIASAPRDGSRIYAISYTDKWPPSLFYVSTVYWAGDMWLCEDLNDVDEPTHWMAMQAPVAPPIAISYT
jgi:hypothetical protein